MAATKYLIAATPGNIGLQLVDGHDAVIVQANSAAEATALAQAQAKAMGGSTIWNATPVDPVTILDMAGWTIVVDLASTNTANAHDLGQVTYVGVVGDTITSFFTNAAAAINVAGIGITHASYTAGTLTISAATTDSLGDKYTTVVLTPPTPSVGSADVASIGGTGRFISSGPLAYSFAQSAVIASVTNHGNSSAALTATITTSWGIPGVICGFRQAVPLTGEYPSH